MITDRPVEVAPGVFASVAAIGSLPGADPLDRAAAAGLPPWRATEYLAARTLLRRLLAAVCDAGTAAARIDAAPSGRPLLVGCPDVDVSLSHDAGTVAAAVGLRRRVGVDVAAPVTVRPALLRRCCTPDVAARIAALSAEPAAVEFAAIWAVQEACVKADGTGIGGRPWTIPVGFRAGHGTWGGYRWRVYRSRLRPPVACAYRPGR